MPNQCNLCTVDYEMKLEMIFKCIEGNRVKEIRTYKLENLSMQPC